MWSSSESEESEFELDSDSDKLYLLIFFLVYAMLTLSGLEMYSSKDS